MKINIVFIFICIFIFALFKTAHGGLVLGLVERIHSTVHKINEDVHNILLPKDKNNEVTSENKQKEIKDDTANTVKSNNDNNGSKIIFATTEKSIKNNTVIDFPIKPHYESEIIQGTSEESFVFVTSSSTVAPVSSTTVKEGRENFAAGCSTGYKRTPDGRCKPTL